MFLCLVGLILQPSNFGGERCQGPAPSFLDGLTESCCMIRAPMGAMAARVRPLNGLPGTLRYIIMKRAIA